MKRVKINEKVGISADFVTILEQCVGYRAECEKNARAFYLKRKCICDKTQVRFTSNARAFDSKRKGVFGEFRKGKHDGLSGLAGIFIKCIYAGCGKIQRLYFSTPVYREFAKPEPTPTTRQAVAWGRPVLHYRSVSFVRGGWIPWLDLIRSKSVVSERKKSRSSSSCFCGSAASRRWYTARMRPRNVRSVRSPF